MEWGVRIGFDADAAFGLLGVPAPIGRCVSYPLGRMVSRLSR